MPAWVLPALIAGSSALANWFGNKGQKVKGYSYSGSKTDQSFNTHFNNFSNQLNTTVYDPMLQQYRDQLIGSGQGLLGKIPLTSPQEFAQSVLERNVSGINKQAELANKLFSNQLAMRGLGSSTMAANANARLAEEQRVQQLIQNSNALPFLQRQAEIENLQLQNAQRQLAASIFASIPKDTYSEAWQGGDSWGGSSSSTTSEGITEQQTSGNSLAGLFSALAPLLGFLGGLGVFGGTGGAQKSSPMVTQTADGLFAPYQGTTGLPYWMYYLRPGGR